jgi:soluble lytic murein transglycosylase
MKRVLVALAVCLAANAASASIAVFSDGRNMKIESYVVEEDTIHLTFAGGGKMSMALRRLERIVDDEVSTPEVVEEVKKIVEEGVFPKRSWNYSEVSPPLWQSKYNDIIIAAAKKFDVDAALVSAVIKAESDYNPRELSHKGARGLMQLMPETARPMARVRGLAFQEGELLDDPAANIELGSAYLGGLVRDFGDARLAVAAYNAGPTRVREWWGARKSDDLEVWVEQIPYNETRNFVRRVMIGWEEYRRLYADAGSPTTLTR